MTRKIVLTLLTVFGATLGACAHAGHSDTASVPAAGSGAPNVLAALLDSNQLTSLSTAVINAGVEGSFAIPTANYTVLAPSDAAFRALTVDFLSSPRLGGILAFHVIPGALKAADLTNGMMVTTLWGLTMEVMTSGSSVTFVGGRNNATVVMADIPAGLSVIHVVDNVLDRRANAATASGPAAATLSRVDDSHMHPPNPMTPGGAPITVNAAG